MEELREYISSSYVYVITEAEITFRSIVDEGRQLVTTLTSTSLYGSIYRNIQLNANRIYYYLIILPSQTGFYIPGIINMCKNFKRTIYLSNSGHLMSGSIGLLIGSLITYILQGWLFPQTRYLSQVRAVIAKHGRGSQGIAFVEQLPLPLTVKANDVLVRVKAASVDPIDLHTAFGRTRVLPQLFHKIMRTKDYYYTLLGRDCVGTVIDVGLNATKFEPGDEVWLAVPYWLTGTMIEYITVNESYVSHKPERLDFVDAASLPFSGCIALDCVKRRAGIVDVRSGKGKRVLVHCGNTATGFIIIQLCSLYNVNITTSCASHAVNRMVDAGAHSILLLDQISPSVSPCRIYDIVFNTIGESAAEFCLSHAREGGLVIDASAMNYVPKEVPNFLMSNLYIAWLKFLQKLNINPWKDVLMNGTILDELTELVNEGRLQPISDRVFNAKYCERALRWYFQAGKVVGKPIICFDVPGDKEFRH